MLPHALLPVHSFPKVLLNFCSAILLNLLEAPDAHINLVGICTVQKIKIAAVTYLSVEQEHNGFNLIVGDLVTKQLAYMTNRGDGPSCPILLSPGCHAISNSTLHEPWPKVMRSTKLIQVLFHMFPFTYVSNSIPVFCWQ